MQPSIKANELAESLAKQFKTLVKLSVPIGEDSEISSFCK